MPYYKNIVREGENFKKKIYELKNNYSFITEVSGNGLLLAIHLDKSINVLDIEKI